MSELAYNTNGIDIYTFTNPHLNSFCISLYVRAGSMFESDTNNGITHLLEHVVYRNLKNRFNGDLYELMALNGVDMSACTYKEFLRFTVEGTKSGFDFAADLILKMFDDINLANDEFMCEKDRIKAEIRENDEKHSLDYIYNKSVWGGTCIEKNITGCYSTLNRISLKGLNEYRNLVFSAGNVFIYITGNVSDESVEVLKHKLAKVNVNQCNPNYVNKVDNIGDLFNRDKAIRVKQDFWNYIKIGFDIETQKYKGGIHDLIYAVLFKGDKALLYNSISEDNPIVYSYDSTYEQYDDVSNISLKFEVEAEKIEEAFMLVVETLNNLKNGQFNFEANFQGESVGWERALDNVDALNWNLAYYNHILKTDSVDYEKKNFGRLDGITKNDIITAAKEIFRTKNMTVAIKGNKRKTDVEKITQILNGLDID